MGEGVAGALAQGRSRCAGPAAGPRLGRAAADLAAALLLVCRLLLRAAG